MAVCIGFEMGWKSGSVQHYQSYIYTCWIRMYGFVILVPYNKSVMTFKVKVVNLDNP